MNDESRGLRRSLAELCGTYNELVANKDTIDFRLGSHEPYGQAESGTDPERVYENESKSLSDELRRVVVKLIEAGQRIRSIEGF
jgi:hypothetical protein